LIEFGIIELWKGDSAVFYTEDRETAFIILSGQADFKFDDQLWERIGGRRSVFDGKAHSVYLPREKEVVISAQMHFKVEVCGLPLKKIRSRGSYSRSIPVE